MTLQKNSLLLILAFLLLITTGSTSVHNTFGEKIDIDTLQDVVDNLKLDSSDTETCHNCNLFKEDDLIFIKLKKATKKTKDQKDKKPDIYKVLKLLKSMNLDLYSDKVLYRYLDEHGEYKNLTVREHNENALYNKLNPGASFKEIPGVPWKEGYGDVLNTLIVQKKHGIVNGYNDKTLQKLRQSKLISQALPLCTYTKIGPQGAFKQVVVEGISDKDEKKIFETLNLSPPKAATRIYNMENLSRKEREQLLKILCESTTVKYVYVGCTGSIINH